MNKGICSSSVASRAQGFLFSAPLSAGELAKLGRGIAT
jgi:hypothetical protein